MKFNFPADIGKLSPNEKIEFYSFLAHSLTVAVRAAWADLQISQDEKVDRMRWINEVTHRVTNRLLDLVNQENLWTEEQVWDLIKQHVSQNQAIGGEISLAIEKSYSQVTQRSFQKAKI